MEISGTSFETCHASIVRNMNEAESFGEKLKARCLRTGPAPKFEEDEPRGIVSEEDVELLARASDHYLETIAEGEFAE